MLSSAVEAASGNSDSKCASSSSAIAVSYVNYAQLHLRQHVFSCKDSAQAPPVPIINSNK
jgi:hypothetical protein